jgi:hypothetical protein
VPFDSAASRLWRDPPLAQDNSTSDACIGPFDSARPHFQCALPSLRTTRPAMRALSEPSSARGH